MKTVYSYLRLILFFAGVLVGVQLPVYVEQYGQSLEAHATESRRSLSGFQEDADRYFDGDLQQLIDYYKADGDGVFFDGGQSIEAIHQRHSTLSNALEAFRSDTWSAYTQAFISPVPDIQQEVRANYSYSVKLDAAAISLGIVSGLLLSLSGETLVRFLRLLLVPIGRRSRRRHS